MLAIIRSLFKSLKAKLGRLQVKMYLIRNLPGMYGVLLRSRMIKKYFASVGNNLLIHEGFRFRNIHKVILGNNVTIGVNSYVQGGGWIEIGDNSILSPNVSIWTHQHDYKNADIPIREQAGRYQNVKIGNDVWIGTGSTIGPGSTIGDGAVIKPGSVIVDEEIKPYSIMAGNPAQIIGTRISHRNRMNLNIGPNNIFDNVYKQIETGSVSTKKVTTV